MRALLVVGFVIAAAATVLVVVGEDVRLLRLAAVLALWAALIAAFAVTRSRRDARAAAMREDEAQLAYQLELHREVAARREYEADLTRQLANEQSDQLGELREQLDRLTGVLASLVDGEVTVSRLTLSAESARFRPASAAIAPGASQVVTSGAGSPREIVEGVEADTVDAVAQGAVPDGRAAAWSAPASGPDGSGRVEAPAAAWARRHADLAREARDAESAPAPSPAPSPAFVRKPAPTPSPAFVREPAPTPSPAPAPEPAPASAPTPSPAFVREPAPASAPTPSPSVQPAPATSWPSPTPATAPVPPESTVPGSPIPAQPDGATDGPALAEPAEAQAEELAEPEPGEHQSGGVSVSQLLAAYGLSGTGRRRRRE